MVNEAVYKTNNFLLEVQLDLVSKFRAYKINLHGSHDIYIIFKNT